MSAMLGTLRATNSELASTCHNILNPSLKVVLSVSTMCKIALQTLLVITTMLSANCECPKS